MGDVTIYVTIWWWRTLKDILDTQFLLCECVEQGHIPAPRNILTKRSSPDFKPFIFEQKQFQLGKLTRYAYYLHPERL
jgi:hypothetical protein